MSRRLGRRFLRRAPSVWYPEVQIPGCLAFWDPARGVVLSGSNVVTVVDQTGLAHTMTGVGGLEPQYVANDAGFPAFSFNGARYMTTPDAANLSSYGSPSKFTMSAWVKRTFTGGVQVYLADWGPALFAYQLWMTDGLVVLETNGATGGNSNFSHAFNGAWKHVTITYDGSLAAASRGLIYIDGSAVAEADAGTPPATIADTGNATAIGAQSNGALPLTGSVGYVGIWGRVLTAAEVSELYNGYQKRN